MKNNKSHIQRELFFDKLVYMDKWRKNISGKNEYKVLEMLARLGYKENYDFIRQYPISSMFVLDVAFVNEKINIEIDGSSHNDKKQKTKDKRQGKR